MLNKMRYIYSLMEEIETKGQSSIYMGECLKAFREVLNDMIKEEKGEKENEQIVSANN